MCVYEGRMERIKKNNVKIMWNRKWMQIKNVFYSQRNNLKNINLIIWMCNLCAANWEPNGLQMQNCVRVDFNSEQITNFSLFSIKWNKVCSYITLYMARYNKYWNNIFFCFAHFIYINRDQRNSRLCRELFKNVFGWKLWKIHKSIDKQYCDKMVNKLMTISKCVIRFQWISNSKLRQKQSLLWEFRVWCMRSWDLH